MTTNFLQFDPGGTGAMSDVDYAAASQRLTGVVPGLAQSTLHNKLFLQTSTMSAAIGQVLSDLGYTVADSNYTTLKAAILAAFHYTPALPNNYMKGPACTWAGVATITVPSGIRARDTTNAADIVTSTNLTVNLASSGALGLDTGAEAASTWYYVYLIMKADGTVSAVFSATNEAASGTITLPATYIYKRQLPFAVKNNASSNLVKIIYGGPTLSGPMYFYDTDFTGTNTDQTNIGIGSASTSFAALSAAAYVPPISTMCLLHFEKVTSGLINWRPTGSSATDGVKYSLVDNTFDETWVPTNASQSVDYKVNGGSVDTSVRAYIINGVT